MDEDKKEKGKKELDTLRMMFERWVQSDVNWAARVITEEGSTGADDEWDFLRRDWIEKLEHWISPYVFRLYRTGYITEDELRKFGEESSDVIETMAAALYSLGRNNKNE